MDAVQPEGFPKCAVRSEEHTSELQSLAYLVCRLLLEKKKKHGVELQTTTAQRTTRSPVHTQRAAHDAPGTLRSPRALIAALSCFYCFFFFFFNDTATTEIYPLSLHDALPISEMLQCCNVLTGDEFCDAVD